MKSRKFNPYMAQANAQWAASVLNMQVNPQSGPDLISERCDIELKFTLVEPVGRTDYPKAWTVLEHQMQYPNGKPIYWGLGTYKLKTKVRSVRISDIPLLETLVTERELYIVSWDWMKQYEPHQTKGQTEQSTWEWTLRYPKLNGLPKVISSHDVEKGKVHFTEGTNEEDLIITTLAVPI